MSPSTGTFDPSVHLDHPDGARVRRKRRVLYGVSSVLLALLVGLAVVEAADVADVYGVDTAHARAEGGGYELDVRYGTVSRPGLATPFEITVRRAGGFDDPVTVAVDGDYLSIWDENGLDPQPAGATADDRAVVWEFDPPRRGDTIVISFDARIEPAVHRGKPGRVAVLDEAHGEVVAVTFTTRVLP